MIPSDRIRGRRRRSARPAGRDASVAVEPLEGRALLSLYTIVPGPASPPASVQYFAHSRHPSGIVVKAPHFYASYTGPHLAELDAVRATGTLSPNGSVFTFTGTNAGRISKAPAVYVWGIDRSPTPPPGPFEGRPGVTFDAVVIVSLDASLRPSAQVKDLVTGATTPLPPGSATISGRTVSVVVPTSLLPSTGLAPSQYRFNYWPEDGGPPIASSVASFAPENTTAQVG
jgi:hypothetical protein